MHKKKVARLTAFLALLCGAVLGQTNRDEVIQITFPTTGALIDTDTVAVSLYVAPFFVLGDPGCTDCDGYLNVYLNDELDGTITAGTSYTIDGLTDGEYFLEIEAVDPNGNSFSPMVFDTVSFMVDVPSLADLCPPSELTIFAGDQENVLSWEEPAAGLGGGIGCGDFLITSLPFTDTGTNVGMGDDWDVTFSDGEDVAYTLNVTAPMVIDVTLCDAATDYDTKLEIFTADENCIETTTGYYNDDYTCVYNGLYSSIIGAALEPGQYYIVVDGFGGSTGNYGITVTQSGMQAASMPNLKAEVVEETEKMLSLGYSQDVVDAYLQELHGTTSNDVSRDIDPECGDFQTYRIYDALTGQIVAEVDTNYYVHTGLTNGETYCYYVTAVYAQGESDTTNHVCGTPAPFTPAPPTNVAATPLDEEVLVTWTSPDVPQLGIPYSEDFASELVDMWTWDGDNWSIYSFFGNPEPSARFSWTPSTTNYDMSLYSPLIPIGGNTELLLQYDIYLNDFGNTGTEHLSVEYFANGVWTSVRDFSNSGDIFWTTYTDTIVGLSGSTQLRFRAYGDDSFEIDYWYVDNVSLTAVNLNREIEGAEWWTDMGYTPGATMPMVLYVTNASSDAEWLDEATLDFPDGVTVVDATDLTVLDNDRFLTYDGSTGNGALVTWYDGDGGYGNIYDTETAATVVTLHFDSSLSGPIDIPWTLSGDDWGSDPHDITGVLTLTMQTWADYEFMGYNVYLDSVLVNDTPLMGNSYLVTGLTNLVTYQFGVTSVHYPDYESEMITVEATPIYLYGDITGTVTDPNGAPLDSAVVTAGGISDTTGADGVYFIEGLPPGVYSVAVSRDEFDRGEADVTVIAQADPVVLDFTLIPTLGRAYGLVAQGGDHQVQLAWRVPGGELEYDLAYYDDVFESQIGCGSDCEFGVRFTPLGYPATLQQLLISVQGDAGTFDANIIAYLDPDGMAAGPVGDPIVLATGLDLSSPDGSLTQYLVDVSAADLVVNSGDVYIFIQENFSGFMGIANDIDPQSPEYYDRNWVAVGGVYQTIFDAVGGDPSLTGDFGMMATFFGVAGQAVTLNNQNETVEIPVRRQSQPVTATELATVAPEGVPQEHSEATNPPNVIRLEDILTPVRPTSLARQDSLVGYNVYQALDAGDSLVATTDGDTTVTVTVPENYVEYCYYVKVRWLTESYGELESKPSTVACTIPFTPGDADFDSDVDVTDLLSVVDFILGVSIPTPEQFRNTDVNHDETLNIADVVMIVDLIYGTNNRAIAFDPEAVAEVTLTSADNIALRFNLDYEGMVRGLQFTLRYDPSMVAMGAPQLVVLQDQVVISGNEAQPGELTVVVVNTAGGGIQQADGQVLVVPLSLKARRGETARIDLRDVLLAGPEGRLIPVQAKSTTLDMEILPRQFALHQNFPNPFNPVTEIQFDLPEQGQVTLTIYNLAGRRVRTLISGEMKAGYHSVVWNGLSDSGKPAASGIYFYSLEAKNFHATKKMVLLK
jgi:hypothetical protein